MDKVNVRNLDEIQEDDRERRSPKLGILLLTSMGVGALAVVGFISREGDGAPAESEDQALAELVESHRDRAAERAPDTLGADEATFAALLSDEPNPTTAAVAVKDERGRIVKQGELDPLSDQASVLPPPAEDRLPVVPLPAGTMLNATAVTTEPHRTSMP